ncbi:uncharacterized protein LOC143282437 [Babylonia areolata]|uniref:uncharacterized protein LOC143282437 n=1 Tax=Babylonia areolata TaxID=304850 RepID=UPI003FD4BF2D
MMYCPGTDCKLKTYANKDRKDAGDSDLSRSQKPCADKHTGEGSVHSSDSFGFVCPDSRQKRRISSEKGRKTSAKDDDDVFLDMDVQDDTHSSSSDQTLPYCDGQPLVCWEIDPARKENNDNSDAEQDISAISSHSFGKKFRRHSSESESRIRKRRDNDGFQRNHFPGSPDTFRHGEASPMLPPLPTYASPFTPGSMYNVPMDNERVLLECFSAPGSQAPSSVRSAPSVRLLSPDRHDHPHLEEDVFAGLCNNKSVADNDQIATNRESLSNYPQTDTRMSHADSEAPTNEQFDDSRVSVRKTKTESVDDQYQDFTDDFHADYPDDDVFMENETECQKDCLRDIGTICSQTKKEVYVSCEHSEPPKNISPDLKDTSSLLLDMPGNCPRTDIVVNYVTAPDGRLLSPVSKKQTRHIDEITPEKDKNHSNKTGQKRKQFVEELHAKLSQVPVKKYETNYDDKDCVKDHVSVTEEVVLNNYRNFVDSPTDGSGSLLKTTYKNTTSVKDDELEQSTSGAVHTACDSDGLIPEESDIREDRTTSDATFAYGASDEDTDMHYGDDGIAEELGNHTSVDHPKLDKAQDCEQSNNIHTSPRPGPAVNESVLEIQTEEKADVELLEDESFDKRRPPRESDGSLEDRVQNFIAHGSQFTPRAVVRSNSLPVLCGMENTASPLTNCEHDELHTPGATGDSKLHIPGAITSRSNSYPGASAGDCSVSSGRPSCAPSPVATHDEAADSEKEDKVVDVLPQNNCGLSSESAEETGTELKEQSVTTEQPAESDEHILLDPGHVVDGGEVVTKTTPRRSPGGDSGDQLLQWVVPCAAHGSAFCACEGIDIHTAQDVAASPKVGPWLCTPGTPIPGTPFCDYSKLIYSPFPVVGGMTPARPEAQDTPAGSPKLPSSPELDLYSCGGKRFAARESQPSPKRRSVIPSKSECDAGSPSSKRAETCDAICDDSPLKQPADRLGNKSDFIGNCEGNVKTAEEIDELFLENEERELIAAAEESEKNMANLTPEEKQKLFDTSLEISSDAHVPDIVGNYSPETNSLCMVSDCNVTETQPPDACAALDDPDKVMTADSESVEEREVSVPESKENNISSIVQETNHPVDVEDSTLVSDIASDSDVSKESTVISLPQKTESLESDMTVFPCTPSDKRTDVSADIVVKQEPEEEPMSLNADCKICPDAHTPGDVSDTNSVGTMDSDSVNDVRIITLGDSDMDITFESEDSKDSSEIETSLMGRDPETVSKQPLSESKKIITIAQYKERRKQQAENKSTAVTPGTDKTPQRCSGVSHSSANSDHRTNPTSKTGTPTKEGPSAASSKQMVRSPDCVLSLKHGLTEGPISKVQRTESVPAELSRKVAVELKRSSSFHGQHPAIKRFKHERDESLDTVKAELKKQARTSRVESERKTRSPQHRPADRSPRVTPTAATKGTSSHHPPATHAASVDRTMREAKKRDIAQREKAAKEARRKERTEKKRDVVENKKETITKSGQGSISFRLESSASEHTKPTKRKGITKDRNIIPTCSDALKPCSVVVSKISSLDFKSSNLKDDSDEDENDDALIIESETISISSQIEVHKTTRRLPRTQTEPSSHTEPMQTSTQDEQISSQAPGKSQSLVPSPKQDEAVSTASVESQRSQTSTPERMSVGDPESSPEPIEVDDDTSTQNEDADSGGPSSTTTHLEGTSARTRSDYVCRRKSPPSPPSSSPHPVSDKPQSQTAQHTSSETDPSSKPQDGCSTTGCASPTTSGARTDTADDNKAQNETGGDGGSSERNSRRPDKDAGAPAGAVHAGGTGTDRQLSDQLAALLREKERMLAEFAQRNKELEQKLEGLRVELQGNKQKSDP